MEIREGRHDPLDNFPLVERTSTGFPILNLSITWEQFRDIYGEDPDYIYFNDPEDEADLWANYMTSKLWRLNNLYTISNKFGEEVRYVMNWAQHKVYAATLIHPRIIILKSRQQGISTHWLVSFFDDALIEDNFEIGLMSQGQKESKVLFRRVKRLWEKLPDFVKSYMDISLSRDTKEELGFSNGAVMYLQSSFRSGTLQRLHISELGKISAKYPEKAEETKTGSLQAIKAGNTVVIESTAEGRKNLFYDLWHTAVDFKGRRTGKDFLPVFLSWAHDPDCSITEEQIIDREAEEYFIKLEHELNTTLTDGQKWWWVGQKRELGDKMGQEYPGTPEEAFAAVRDGAYYAVPFRTSVEAKGQVITSNKELAETSNGKLKYMPNPHKHNNVSPLWEPTIPVEVAMDLGMNDTMVLTFFQRFRKEKRIIDCYYNSGEGLSHYANIMKDKPYKYGKIWGPHDMAVRELGTGLSRKARFRELGVKVTVIPRSDVNTGIEQVRKMIPSIWIDHDLCKYLISMFFSYSKQWDERLGTWKDKPLHDEWSNPADSVRYMAVSRGSGADYGVEGSLKSGKSSALGGTRRRRARRSNVVDGMAF